MKCVLSLLLAALAGCCLAVTVIPTPQQMSIRVDNFVKVYADENLALNTFGQRDKGHFNVVHDVELPANTKVVTLKVKNAGGAGDITCDIGGEDCSTMNWKCNAIGKNQDPGKAFPGIYSSTYDDSDWNDLVMVTDSLKEGNVWWAGDQSLLNAVCRLVLYDVLTIKVDDEAKVYGDGSVLHNTFPMAGSQTRETYEVNLLPGVEVIVLKVNDMIGQASIICDINGDDCINMDWKCKPLDNISQEPDDKYPGVFDVDYYDGDWETKVDFTERMWWGGAQDRANAVCRLVRGPRLTIQVDDEVKVYTDNTLRINTFAKSGSQARETFKVTIMPGTEVITLKVNNIGGPASILCDIDGADCTTMDWKCMPINFNQEPQDRYPGAFGADYDESRWESLVELSGNKWWGGAQDRTNAVCRLVIAE